MKHNDDEMFEIVEKLHAILHKGDPDKLREYRALGALWFFFRGLARASSRDSPVYFPKKPMGMLRDLYPEFADANEQHDSQELYLRLVDAIDTGTRGLQAHIWKLPGRLESESLATHLLKGTQSSIVICKSCDTESRRPEPFVSISLDIDALQTSKPCTEPVSTSLVDREKPQINMGHGPIQTFSLEFTFFYYYTAQSPRFVKIDSVVDGWNVSRITELFVPQLIGNVDHDRVVLADVDTERFLQGYGRINKVYTRSDAITGKIVSDIVARGRKLIAYEVTRKDIEIRQQNQSTGAGYTLAIIAVRHHFSNSRVSVHFHRAFPSIMTINGNMSGADIYMHLAIKFSTYMGKSVYVRGKFGFSRIPRDAFSVYARASIDEENPDTTGTNPTMLIDPDAPVGKTALARGGAWQLDIRWKDDDGVAEKASGVIYNPALHRKVRVQANILRDDDEDDDEDDVFSSVWRDSVQHYGDMIEQTRKRIKMRHHDARTRIAPPIVERPIALEDLLAQYVCVEELSGDNAYFCNLCHGKRTASKRILLAAEDLPGVLAIHLKRFRYDMYGRSTDKIVRSVDFPFDRPLNMAPYTTREEGRIDYTLFAVVVHVGSRSESGHYVSYVRRTHEDGSNRWYLCNDSMIRLSSLAADGTAKLPEKAFTNAYMLFYEKSA